MKNRIHFLGYLGGAEKSDAYHAAQLLVVPSRQEAMSIVAIEAGICGTPVLLTDQCGFDRVEEIGGGWVVPASVEGIKQGLLKVMRQTELLKPAKLNIRKLVKEYFAWDNVVLSYINLYDQLIQPKNNNG
jgi:glycosyltransferase involved in cell wall biosynthesis